MAYERSPEPPCMQGGEVDQYFSASMIVSTRVVFAGSAGSSDPYVIAAPKIIDLPEELTAGELERAEVVLRVRIVVGGEFRVNSVFVSMH